MYIIWSFIVNHEETAERSRTASAAETWGGDHVVTGMQMPQFISSLGVSLLGKEKHIFNLEKNCHCRCVSLKSWMHFYCRGVLDNVSSYLNYSFTTLSLSHKVKLVLQTLDSRRITVHFVKYTSYHTALLYDALCMVRHVQCRMRHVVYAPTCTEQCEHAVTCTVRARKAAKIVKILIFFRSLPCFLVENI